MNYYVYLTDVKEIYTSSNGKASRACEDLVFHVALFLTQEKARCDSTTF